MFRIREGKAKVVIPVVINALFIQAFKTNVFEFIGIYRGVDIITVVFVTGFCGVNSVLNTQLIQA